MACAGDVPTLETLAAVTLLREHLPDLKVRVVNVVDLMRLEPDTEHPHGLSDRDYDTLFTVDKPVIFAYHGYPWLIHRLAYRRAGAEHLHVRGYKEEGTVTTPFDMLVRNDMDRFHLVMDVIDRVPGSAPRRARPPAHGRRAHAPSALHARLRRGPPRGAELEVDRPPVRLLVVNAGSSSLKLSALDDADAVIAERTLADWDGDDRPIGEFALGVGAIDAVGHRVVHGGPVHRAGRRRRRRDRAAGRARHARAPASTARDRRDRRRAPRRPRATHVACFDTAFHATLPPAAHVYALPAAWRERWPLRRFGFHGLSHAYAARRAELAGRAVDDLRLVSCHLGAGASLCAVRGGRSVDTTMGFTPLEGLVMATRAGSIDPGLVLWLIQSGGLTAQEVLDGLEHGSGLAGLAGTPDMREVVDRRARGDADAVLAFDVYTHRLRRELGAMRAALDPSMPASSPAGWGSTRPVRAACGLQLDPAANARTTGDGEISAAGAAIRTFVVTAREDLEIARQVRALD